MPLQCNLDLTPEALQKTPKEGHIGKEMLLLILFLPLAMLLKQSLGWDPAEDNSPMMLSEHTQKEIVDLHNDFRRKVKPMASNMVKMTWSKEAAKGAKEWAEKCTGRRSTMQQRVVNGVHCAESTMKATYPSTWEEVITWWFSKQSNFQYGIGAINPMKDILSYTQLIWYNTHEVGCALTYCPGNEYAFFYVCRYCPAGNIQGQVLTPYKEGPPCGDCPNNCEDKLCTNPCKYVDNAWGCKQLMEMFNCNETPLINECQATCNCLTEII